MSNLVKYVYDLLFHSYHSLNDEREVKRDMKQLRKVEGRELRAHKRTRKEAENLQNIERIDIQLAKRLLQMHLETSIQRELEKYVEIEVAILDDQRRIQNDTLTANTKRGLSIRDKNAELKNLQSLASVIARTKALGSNIQVIRFLHQLERDTKVKIKAIERELHLEEESIRFAIKELRFLEVLEAAFHKRRQELLALTH